MARINADTILVGHYRYAPEIGSFVGAVASQDQSTRTMTVLVVGVEATEYAILDWIKETIALMRAAGATNVQAPDMHDRAARNEPMN